MAVTMHAKSDSEVTCSVDGAASSPPRSPRRPLYYVQSPSNHDYGAADKMSYGSSPPGSPNHQNGANQVHYHYYHCSPVHHSRESSTSRFSASLRNPRHLSFSSSVAWRKLQRGHGPEIEGGGDDEDDDDDDGDGHYGGPCHGVRLYVCFLVLFLAVFAVFSLILWGASRGYRPEMIVKNVVFESFNIQAGNDPSGVPTDMLTLNSTVRISYRNPATFFGVHVTATPLQLHYYQLEVATGHMKKFYQSRKSQRAVITMVAGHQVPLYGGVSFLSNAREHFPTVAVPLNLTFVMRSKAYILGKLVKSKFYRRIRCPITLQGNKLGKPLNLTNLCIYH
ncbi:hypothetical protein SAY87_022969 [Trapa incisa]|uniref:Late embryogenesis abundant protein LEA-2 subgroup domain-containing protein n=1 Tax=Trapa incisa TaxID=236973 RepID=A0AAN7K1R4_9MYRT|nr:hypothetical protein SAY87_022969 [Trapa incisa]